MIVAPWFSGSACGIITQGLRVQILHGSQKSTFGEEGNRKPSHKIFFPRKNSEPFLPCLQGSKSSMLNSIGEEGNGKPPDEFHFPRKNSEPCLQFLQRSESSIRRRISLNMSNIQLGSSLVNYVGTGHHGLYKALTKELSEKIREEDKIYAEMVLRLRACFQQKFKIMNT